MPRVTPKAFWEGLSEEEQARLLDFIREHGSKATSIEFRCSIHTMATIKKAHKIVDDQRVLNIRKSRLITAHFEQQRSSKGISTWGHR